MVTPVTRTSLRSAAEPAAAAQTAAMVFPAGSGVSPPPVLPPVPRSMPLEKSIAVPAEAATLRSRSSIKYELATVVLI